jgi:hypothetical protein
VLFTVKVFQLVTVRPVTVPALQDTFQVTLPVNGPLNHVADNTPVLELKVNQTLDLGHKSPVASVTNNG